MKAFKAYDIRGVWNKDLLEEDVYRIGFFLPNLLKTQKILVGRDIRHSSNTIFNALCRGINDAGADVDDAGLTTTPLIYWATGKYEYGGSVMITASHNPKDHNGLKISGAGVVPVGYDTGLSKLKYHVENTYIKPVKDKGKINIVNISDDYILFLKKYVVEYDNIRFGVDCSNGMASLFIKQLIGNHAYYINDIADGNFPGHEPNPLESENQEQIKQLVINRQCDFGVIFDGDADRVMFIDENGRFVSPDLIIALMGHYFFEYRGQEGLVLQDIRSSRAVSNYLAQFGTTVETWRVGRAYGAAKLREINGIFGGELAGHYYFRDFYYSDSGLLAALIVLDLLNTFKASGFTLSQLIHTISPFFNSGEINFKVEHKKEAMDAVVAHFTSKKEPERFLDFDGYRLDYEDFWFNIRPSNTEPYLRFIAEAKDQQHLDDITQQVKQIISTFD